LKSFFASNPATYIQNAMEEFTALPDDGTTAISNTVNLLVTGTTAYEEARPESTFFIDTTALMAERQYSKNWYHGHSRRRLYNSV
jgi:hypothetical protein